MHEADRTHDVAALGFGEQGMPFAFQQPDVRIVPDNDVEIAVRADLLEEPNVARVEPIG